MKVNHCICVSVCPCTSFTDPTNLQLPSRQEGREGWCRAKHMTTIQHSFQISVNSRSLYRAFDRHIWAKFQACFPFDRFLCLDDVLGCSTAVSHVHYEKLHTFLARTRAPEGLIQETASTSWARKIGHGQRSGSGNSVCPQLSRQRMPATYEHLYLSTVKAMSNNVSDKPSGGTRGSRRSEMIYPLSSEIIYPLSFIHSP